MKRFAALLVAATLMGGCATHSDTVPRTSAPGVVATPATPTVYRGEVWTWDPTTNVVTLVQGAEKVRVLVTPDQLVGIQPKNIVTIRGVPAGPAEIERMIVATPPMRAVPTGVTDQTEVTGTVTAVDPNGRVSLATSRGPIDVWVATPVSSQFRAGAPVRVKSTVQTVTFVPLSGAPAEGPTPAALAGGEPGDHAVITGRILAVEPTGRITIESPRGPVNLWVANASRYVVGQSVQARTSVLATP